MKTVIIFGGSGFIGKKIAHRLSKLGYRIIIPYQLSTDEAKLRLLGTFGQIIPLRFNNLKECHIIKSIENADIVLNFKTQWDEKPITYIKGIFEFNVELINIIKSFDKNKSFIYFSGMGVNAQSKSKRTIAIYESEKFIKENMINSTIIRPGIIFGPGDNFLNKLIPIFKLSFFIPLFGSGKSKIQPVYIDDVIKGLEAIINNNMAGSETFEFVGNETLTYKELYKYICECLKINRVFIHIPFFVAKIIVSFLNFISINIISLEQLNLFKDDNISKNRNKKFVDLSIQPQNTKEMIKKNIFTY